MGFQKSAPGERSAISRASEIKSDQKGKTGGGEESEKRDVRCNVRSDRRHATPNGRRPKSRAR